MASCGTALSNAVFDLSAKCALDSSFSFYVITQVPTPRQVNRICMSPACSKVVAAIRNAIRNECIVSYGDNRWELYKEIMDPIAIACNKGSVVVTGPPSVINSATNSTQS